MTFLLTQSLSAEWLFFWSNLCQYNDIYSDASLKWDISESISIIGCRKSTRGSLHTDTYQKVFSFFFPSFKKQLYWPKDGTTLVLIKLLTKQRSWFTCSSACLHEDNNAERKWHKREDYCRDKPDIWLWKLLNWLNATLWQLMELSASLQH